MSQQFSELLGHPHPVCVTGNRQWIMRFFLQELEHRMETCSGCALLVMPHAQSVLSMQAALTQVFGQKSEFAAKIFVTTPAELENWLSTSPDVSQNYCQSCHSCIIWLETSQFEDLSLAYLFHVCAKLSLPPQTSPVFMVPHGLFEVFKHKCPYAIERIALAEDLDCHQPVVYYFSDHADPARILPDKFWKHCKSTQSLVACRTEIHQLRYAESCHRAHLTAQTLAEVQKTGQLNGQNGTQTLIHNFENHYLPHTGTWRHLVGIDPMPDTDLRCCAKHVLPISPVTQKVHLSYLASNRLSLLNILANHQQKSIESGEIPAVFVQIYALYAQLCQNHVLTSSQDLTDAQKCALQYWCQNGLVSCQDNAYVMTTKGRQKFPGMTHFTELGVLHGWRQTTVCESPNHQLMGMISTDFLRQPVSQRFSLGLQPVQRLFHNLLGNTAILRINTEPAASAWLDAMPMCLSFDQTQRVQKLLYAEGYADDDLLLDEVCVSKLAQTQASFADAPAENFIETTLDIAHWWTFAGAQYNAMTVQILALLAPKLRISYGNCHIRLAWARQAGSTITQIIQRLSDLVSAIHRWREHHQNGCTMPELADQTYQAFQKQWQKTHLYSWLLEILPPGMVHQQFMNEMAAWAKSVPNTVIPVVEVQDLRHIDPALRLTHVIPDTISRKTSVKSSATESHRPQKASVMPQKSDSEGADAQSCEHADMQSQVFTSESQPEPSKPIETHPTCGISCRVHSQNTGTRPQNGIMHTRMPWYYIDNDKNLGLALNMMLKQPFIGLDVETTLYDQRLCLIQIGCAEQSFIIDPMAVNITPLAHLFNHPNIIKVIHNASFEKRVLGKLGMQIAPVVDTLCVSRKRHGMKALGGHSLKAVCMREFNLDMDKACQQSHWDKRPLSPVQLEYAALDAEILVYLYQLYFGKQPKLL